MLPFRHNEYLLEPKQYILYPADEGLSIYFFITLPVQVNMALGKQGISGKTVIKNPAGYPPACRREESGPVCTWCGALDARLSENSKNETFLKLS
jgi:hypothetical protein